MFSIIGLTISPTLSLSTLCGWIWVIGWHERKLQIAQLIPIKTATVTVYTTTVWVYVGPPAGCLEIPCAGTTWLVRKRKKLKEIKKFRSKTAQMLILMEGKKQPWGFLPLFFLHFTFCISHFMLPEGRKSQFILLFSGGFHGGRGSRSRHTYPTLPYLPTLPPSIFKTPAKQRDSVSTPNLVCITHILYVLFFILRFFSCGRNLFWSFFLRKGERGTNGGFSENVFFFFLCV